jgi:hypothetical protein
MKKVTKEYFLSENFLRFTQMSCDEPYQNGEFEDYTLEEREQKKRDYDFIQKLIKQKKIIIHYVSELPKTFDKENDIYILNDWTDGMPSSREDIIPSTNKCFNNFLDYIDDTENFIFGLGGSKETLNDNGYKNKSQWQKDLKTIKNLWWGTPKGRNQEWASDIQQWKELCCFPEKCTTEASYGRGWILATYHFIGR